ncbi:ADP-ribosylation factor-like protein 13A [Kryptolebias marmoratus]|uniref:ADP-ribosylation factor-like 13A n=1 Tax=Kryptolebias marmoratus TaxID=37003 RepID=A0A3Q2ZD35_KRYMA|nr:ADP-ribosylation factor-like protein 13A [Kryptolebias marmoratus]XP_037833287.1 ADP-ribosylation factor-like protein 13A [Kryptolebias marmoratus]
MDVDPLLYQVQRRWWLLCSPCSPRGNMFNLMSNCCSWVSKIQEPVRKVTLLVVGLDRAGKTSSIRGMFRVPSGVDTGPTRGCIRTELRVENCLVTLLDAGGSVELRGAWRELCGEAHGVVFVVDSSDRQRMKEAREVLADLLKQPRVAGKPVLVLANKQDKMNALVGSELIEVLSLEKLVNQSRSLCHIEPCSALMDLRRWSDRRTLRGLRWLLRAVCLDYPELCARVAQDSKRPPEPRDRDRKAKPEKVQKKPKAERMRSSKSDLRQGHRPREKKSRAEGKLQPIRSILQTETTLKNKLRTKTRKKSVKAQKGERDEEALEQEREEEEEAEGNEGEQENSIHRDRASSALIPPKKGKLKRRTRVREETLDATELAENDEAPLKAKGEKRKKKKLGKVKRKNKINTEGTPGACSQPVDLSSTFDLYRKAILALKERQDQGQRP